MKKNDEGIRWEGAVAERAAATSPLLTTFNAQGCLGNGNAAMATHVV